MNKPITMIGVVLIILGAVGIVYAIEFVAAIVIGITAVLVGILLGTGRFSKRSVLGKESLVHCVKCGSSIRADAKFCGYCGEETK